MLPTNPVENMITACMLTEVNIISIFHYSAITCTAPAITNGANNCDSATVAWDGTCEATCDAGYAGNATITCNVNNSGTGGFDVTVTCSGTLFLITNSIVLLTVLRTTL